MYRFAFTAGKFLIAFAMIVAACTVSWDWIVNGKLYDCTDGGDLDFWFVGDWVHHPVAVDHVVHGRFMSEPDLIKTGWSLARLWGLWWSFVAFSLIASVVFACFPWVRTVEQFADWLYLRTRGWGLLDLSTGE